MLPACMPPLLHLRLSVSTLSTLSPAVVVEALGDRAVLLCVAAAAAAAAAAASFLLQQQSLLK